MSIKISIRETQLSGYPAQIVEFEVEGQLSPSDLEDFVLELEASSIKYDAIVSMSGRGPTWLYGIWVHAMHPSRSTCIFDPRVGHVVVADHYYNIPAGTVLYEKDSAD